MSKDNIRSALRSFILDKFLPGEPEDSLMDSTPLISSGIITSLSLLELVNFIEHTFSVRLDTSDAGTERMDSIDLLVDLVQLRESGAAEE